MAHAAEGLYAHDANSIMSLFAEEGIRTLSQRLLKIVTSPSDIKRRQPIHEKDRIDPLDPSLRLQLDQEVLKQFPNGYQHLAYLQSCLGFKIKRDMPELTGPVVAPLYRHGDKWLSGDASAIDDPPVESELGTPINGRLPC